jgi:uncharacterized protein
MPLTTLSTATRIQWFSRKPAFNAAPIHEDTWLSFDPADFSPAVRTRLLILQPTPFCNIDCDYCYLPERNNTARMSMGTVVQAARHLRDDGLLGSALTVVWHAGEPLTMPRSFYEDAIAALNETLGPACNVTHSMQTNGTLVDDRWCEFFKRHSVRVGVSVDGPAGLHDAHRRTRTGQGTHQRVLRGMAHLRAHGIPFHAIAVITAATFEQADAFFDFFVEQGVTELGCNYDEAEGKYLRSSLDGQETGHASFLGKLLTRSAQGAPLRIRELAMAFHLIADTHPTYHWHDRSWPQNAQTVPFELITVGHNGDFGTFSPELLGQASAEFGDFILGNVATGSYLDSSRGHRFKRLWDAVIRGTCECERLCAHYRFCGGGAPANKLYENGDLASSETLYCRTMFKRPFDAVLAHLESS